MRRADPSLTRVQVPNLWIHPAGGLNRIVLRRTVAGMNPTMSRADRETFLAGTHVGVLAVAEAGRGPLAVPVWYRYEPGDVLRLTVPQASKKVGLLRAAGRASLCAQTETVPYQYVSVEGPVEVLDKEVDADQREMAIRYLGVKLGERYLNATAADRVNEVLVLLRPERWWSVDFSRMPLG
jgi:nitroimidazol reductase NimA-like FMN-containing flavoprotein (pyridoxamine 5'-phosphate oxidase superfamily)